MFNLLSYSACYDSDDRAPSGGRNTVRPPDGSMLSFVVTSSNALYIYIYIYIYILYIYIYMCV
jgi:hypothetical protein